tara:strand:- start:2063 stop:2527 length:465 start_codon:yes stop_codon:yes gene_type:complete
MTVGKVKDFTFTSDKSAGMKDGGKYPSRKAMVKRESMETPRMMRDEMVKRQTVKAPAAPMGMLRNRGALGVMGNKNPGETMRNTAPALPNEMTMMKKGGHAKMNMGGKMMKDDGYSKMNMGGQMTKKSRGGVPAHSSKPMFEKKSKGGMAKGSC